jgi:hypothetical protein
MGGHILRRRRRRILSDNPTHPDLAHGTSPRNWSNVGLARKTYLPTLSGMDRMPLPPEAFFEGTPPHVRAYIEHLHATLADLHTRIAELQFKQAKNSTNSSLPPSSEHPYAKPDRPTPKSLRGCGGSWGDQAGEEASGDRRPDRGLAGLGTPDAEGERGDQARPAYMESRWPPWRS